MDNNTEQYAYFIKKHQNQLISSGVPKHYWPVLYDKLYNQIFDAGETFSLVQIEYEDEECGEYEPVYQLRVKAEDGIKVSHSRHIYLVDHAWTFRFDMARKQLLSSENLRKRLAGILGLKNENKEQLVVGIMSRLWKYCNPYSVGDSQIAEDSLPVWYIMDEVGCGMMHDDSPNFRMVPFFHAPEYITYSLIYPIKDVDFGQLITRDCVEGIEAGDARKAFLLPWVHSSFLKESFEHVESDPDYFLSGHIRETLPILSNLQNYKNTKSKLKVFSQYKYIHEYLNDPSFELVDTEDEADILWYTSHFKNFEEFSYKPGKFVNQFPFEYILTIKDLLAITCRRTHEHIEDSLEIPPNWLPVTYNLKTELTQFAGYFQRREQLGLDNHWIIKPFNLARGLDTLITNNINHIMRLPFSGPKVAQKYIEKPLLFHRPECGKVKFDIRYVILLKNVKPLEAYIYKNFFLRFANKEFALNNFDEYEQHFTVMNYKGNAQLKHMKCDEFKLEWQQQYSLHPWADVENSITNMLKEMFVSATLEHPPCGISQSPQSRALYAADIMLEWNNENIQPKLLEINWTPDCKRACEYYPNFYNDIFKLLFFNVENTDVFCKL